MTGKLPFNGELGQPTRYVLVDALVSWWDFRLRQNRLSAWRMPGVWGGGGLFVAVGEDAHLEGDRKAAAGGQIELIEG